MRVSASRLLFIPLLAMVVGAFAAAPAFAQNVGTISGTVKDAQGLAIPGATVTLANRVSHASQNTVTDEQQVAADVRKERVDIEDDAKR